MEKELAAVQTATEGNRGGGERGSKALTELGGPERAPKEAEVAASEMVTGAGGTKMPEDTAGRSGFWQQDMLHGDMPGISWPQSMAFSEPASPRAW